jgi:two-component system, chemotaxis family, sensor kinase CheA
MAIDISQFSEMFFDETEELLADLERLLLTVNIDAPDLEDINGIFRIAHSIKGGAATFGFSDLIEITHVLESMLDKIRHGEDVFTAEHQEILLQSRDVLKMQLDALRHNTPVDTEKAADIKMVLESMIDKSALQPVPHILAVHDDSTNLQNHYAKQFHIELPVISARDVEALIEELSLLGDLTHTQKPGECAILELATNEGADVILALCSFVLDPDLVKVVEQKAAQLIEDDSDDLSFGFFDAPKPVKNEQQSVVIKPELLSLPVEPKKYDPKLDTSVINTEASTIRVGVDKVDQLINLVGELVITHAMILKRAEGMDEALYESLLNGITQLGQNSRDLQETAMSMRMMPIEVVFSRFPRMVRELSNKLGKQINLVTQGNNIELDKGLIERIIDPLTHLVRNSIDHGIETSESRLEKGKSAMGRLGLSATHQGGHVLIEVSDDGAGLNREKILKKAKAEGVPIREGISDDEVWQLIFAPGFSTAETVTDLSGRGVGMDVVKRNINSLGGVVSIKSVAGVGTLTTVSLPLTLAIMDGMSIKIGDETYILPLNYVLESFQPAAVNLKEINGTSRVIFVRDRYLPIIPLHEVFDIDARYKDPTSGILVIIAAEDKRAALLVDELVGQQQIVVKNIESNFKKISNVSGATIMGDGSVSLIIDVSDLLNSHYTRAGL